MEPWLTNRRVMTWLSMSPVDVSTSKKQRMIYIAFTLVVTAITSCSLTSSFLSVLYYRSIDFETCVYAIFQVAAEAAVLNLIVIALYKRNRITLFCTNLSGIYNASKDERFQKK